MTGRMLLYVVAGAVLAALWGMSEFAATAEEAMQAAQTRQARELATIEAADREFAATERQLKATK